MSVQCAGNQYMSRRLIEVIQELRDYLGPEAQGLSDNEGESTRGQAVRAFLRCASLTAFAKIFWRTAAFTSASDLI
jgi:hypothetical protein